MLTSTLTARDVIHSKQKIFFLSLYLNKKSHKGLFPNHYDHCYMLISMAATEQLMIVIRHADRSTTSLFEHLFNLYLNA